MKKFYFSFLFLFFIVGIKISFSQWNSNTAINTPVCTANSWQVDLRMMDDDQGGTFIVWKDYRNGSPDIFAQHVDANGFPLWNLNGVGACTNSSDQSTPGLISDGAGGIIVSWSDWRSGIERDLYAQRINASGVPVWTTDGVIVSNKQEREHNQRMVEDGMGGAIVVFEQQNVSSWQWEIWAQRINSNGVTQWAPGGMAVSTILTNFLNERVQSDGKGGVIVTWQDFRNGFDYDVYAQRITYGGVRKWGNGGVLVCNAPGTQNNPKIDPDSASGGCYIAWVDKRNGFDYDIYAQRLDSNGTLKWASTGVAICTSPGNQSAVDLLSNTKVGGLIVAWKDFRSGIGYDVYAQKINPSGVVQWIANGNPVSVATADQINPNITGDGSGGAVIVWQSGGVGTYDVMAQRLNGSGVAQWTTNGVVVGNATGDQSSPKNISDGSGGSIFAWEDNRTGQPDIYCHRIFGDGSQVGIKEANINSEIICFPNPFSQTLNISVALEKDEKISLKIFEITGRELAEVISTNKITPPGINTFQINAEELNLKKGVYLLVLQGKEGKKTKKIIVD